MATSMTFSMRFCTPAKPARMAAPWLCFHSCMAAMKMEAHAIGGAATEPAIEILQRLSRPERLLEAVIGGVLAAESEELSR
jgi:hypothetical protein